MMMEILVTSNNIHLQSAIICKDYKVMGAVGKRPFGGLKNKLSFC